MTNSTEPPLPPFPTLAERVEITREGAKMRLKIDGITFPWHFATQPTVTLDRGIHFVNLSIPVTSVSIDMNPEPWRPVPERHATGAVDVAEAMATDAKQWADADERYTELYDVEVGPHSTGLPRGVATVGGDDDQAGDGVVESDGAVAFRCGGACSIVPVAGGRYECAVTAPACPSRENADR